MLYSINWLKEYVDIEISPEELSERLTMAGLEVEECRKAEPSVKGVVTAEILKIEKHPNADRLTLCKVRSTGGEYSIVCGARNMKEGDKVALALPGARLPSGIAINKAKIRGIISEGMMCSEEELGLAQKSKGIMILPPDTPVGLDVAELLGLDDYVIDVAITPNRGDCLSIMGLAREIGAVTGSPFREISISVKEGAKDVGDYITVDLREPALCRRYTARVVEGVKVSDSPVWLKRRLELCGIRPINNVVDATNYVMLEMGQPLHAFDLEKLKGRTLVIRRAEKGETIKTIDGKERTLDEEMLLIADSEGPQAVAGVMGGEHSEVTEKTTTIVLESAWFEPSSVRKTSKKLSLSTDSSYRFERGVDIEAVGKALDRVAALVAELTGGKVAKGSIDIYPEKFTPCTISLKPERVERSIGIEVKKEEIAEILRALSMRVEEKEGCLEVTPPSFRQDIKCEADLIEEVARLKGYDAIPLAMPVSTIKTRRPSPSFATRRKIASILTGQGFTEVINYSFISRQCFELCGDKDRAGVFIMNPLTEEQVVMRDMLLPSLIQNVQTNLTHKSSDLRLFECRAVFIPRDSGLPEEKWHVASVMYGGRMPAGWCQPEDGVDFYDAKGVVENLLRSLKVGGKISFERAEVSKMFHPGKSATIKVGDRECGIVGEIHPDVQEAFNLKKPVYGFELELETLVASIEKYPAFRQLPKFPESIRDVAFIVDENIPFAEIRDVVYNIDTKLIEKVELFDVYYGKGIPAGKRSLAIRITYRAQDRTLTFQEVEDIHSRVSKELERRFGATLRI